MRAIAEFVMRGRSQAMLVTVISAGTILFYWVGAAALALVTLRQGIQQGFILLLWALLPAVAVAVYGGETAPLVVMTGSFLAAVVLRQTSSWSLALLAISATGVVAALTILAFEPAWLHELVTVVEAFFERFASSLEQQGEAIAIATPTMPQIVGMLGMVNAFTIVICLALGRSWQAALYNPGGFQEEFHSLRLSKRVALPLALVILLCILQGTDWLVWGYILALPLLVAGVALVHGMIATMKMGTGWLVLFYGLLLLINPAKELLILAVLLDSWLDFRSRLKPNSRIDE
ncbi:MAG: hypothetical protein V7711_16870 [Pseudomonadales bacterium]